MFILISSGVDLVGKAPVKNADRAKEMFGFRRTALAAPTTSLRGPPSRCCGARGWAPGSPGNGRFKSVILAQIQTGAGRAGPAGHSTAVDRPQPVRASRTILLSDWDFRADPYSACFCPDTEIRSGMAIPVELTKLRREESAFILQSANGQRFRSSTVVVATGVRCRRLDAWSGSRIPAQFRG
jgi:hypothetical protein